MMTLTCVERLTETMAAGPDGHEWTAVELATEMGDRPSTVISALRALAWDRIVAVTHRRGRGNANTYRYLGGSPQRRSRRYDDDEVLAHLPATLTELAARLDRSRGVAREYAMRLVEREKA